MNATFLLQLIQTAAVVAGVGFALVQLRQLRNQREAQGGAELLRSLQSPQTARAALRLHELPEGLGASEFVAALGDDLPAVINLASLFESMGPLVARGHVPIDIYEDFYRGGTVICWRKMRGYVLERRAAGWPILFEWFQWLAEQMERRAPATTDRPAFERLRHWRSPRDFIRYQRKAAQRPSRPS